MHTAPHLFLLHGLLMLQLFNAMRQPHDARLFENEALREVTGYSAVCGVLNLVQFQSDHDVQLVELLLLF